MFESTFRLSTLVLAAAACIAMPAVARDNPEDAVSNPDKLQYSDVNMRYADMKKDFVRDGVLAEQLEGIRAIQPGMAQDKVKQTLVLQLSHSPLRTIWLVYRSIIGNTALLPLKTTHWQANKILVLQTWRNIH